MSPRQLLPCLTAAVVLALGSTVSAHPGHDHRGQDEVDEFEQQHALLAGLRDPFRSRELLLPILALGAAAGLATRKRGPILTLFAAGLAAGGLGSFSGIALPGSATLATACAMGSMILLGQRGRLMPAAAVLLTTLAGFGQGYSQALKVPLHQLLPAYGAGLIAACSGLLIAGTFAGRFIRNFGSRGAAPSPVAVR